MYSGVVYDDLALDGLIAFWLNTTEWQFAAFVGERPSHPVPERLKEASDFFFHYIFLHVQIEFFFQAR